MGPRSGLDAVEKRKIFCREAKSGLSPYRLSYHDSNFLLIFSLEKSGIRLYSGSYANRKMGHEEV
jgi:hypothetical protein